MAHNHPTHEIDERAEALARTLGMISDTSGYDMCDAIDAAEYLRSGRRGLPLDLPLVKPKVTVPDDLLTDGGGVDAGQWFRRKLSIALGIPFGTKTFEGLVGEVHAIRGSYSRAIAQRNELMAVAHAVAEAKDIQLNDDVMCKLRIVVDNLRGEDAAVKAVDPDEDEDWDE